MRLIVPDHQCTHFNRSHFQYAILTPLCFRRCATLSRSAANVFNLARVKMTNWTRRLLRGTEVDFSFTWLVSAHICRSDDDVGDDKDDDDDWWWFLVLFACVYLDWSSPWSYLSWTISSLHLSSSPIRTWFSRWRPRSSVILTRVPHAILDTRYTMPMRAQRRELYWGGIVSVDDR